MNGISRDSTRNTNSWDKYMQWAGNKNMWNVGNECKWMLQGRDLKELKYLLAGSGRAT